MKIFLGLLFLAWCAGPTLSARQQKPCSGPEYQQFDFWVGEWDVFNPKEVLVGKSRIERIEGGCVILENYTGTTGYSGKSFNVYNASRKKWQQFWVDNQGGVLEFSGTLEGKELRYTGKSTGPKGETVHHKLTFHDQGKDRVRQVWEQSRDDGTTWATVFDGMYHRTK